MYNLLMHNTSLSITKIIFTTITAIGVREKIGMQVFPDHHGLATSKLPLNIRCIIYCII